MMAKVKIVTDSTADIPKHIAEKLGIEIVPLKVHFGDEGFLDGVTIQAEQFYKKLEATNGLPTTSQPSPVEFVNAYKKLAEGEEDVSILSIHISSSLSGTYQSASLAQSMLEEKLDITVIDSKKASYAIGIIVTAVAEAANNGSSKDECIALANHLIKESAVYFLVDSLHYLQKGGRIGKASAVLGSLLNIKPILSLDTEGEVFAVDKVRGQKKALIKIINLLNEFAGGEPVKVGISHAACEEQANKVLDEIKQSFQVQSEVITNIGPVIGTHVGPKTIAIMMIKAPSEK